MSETKNKREELVKQIREALPGMEIKPEDMQFDNIKCYVTIKPIGFLGSDKFAKLQAKVKELGGEFVSAGKLGHFRIQVEPKESSLKEWYDTQDLKEQPLPLPLSLNLNLQVTSPEMLDKILEVVKKYVRPTP